MIHTSPLADLDIPKVNVLSYLFPQDQTPSDEPVWFDAANPSKNVSPRQMLSWIKRVILGLDRLGLKKGDVCLIHTPNNMLVPAAYLGIVGGGRSFSAINPIYTVDEIVHQMKLTEAKVVLAHPSLVKNDVEAAEKAGTNPKIYQFTDDDAMLTDVSGVKDWRHMLGSETEARTYRWKEMTAEESVNTVATINFSSGTTGLPKGVMIGHHGLISNVEQTACIRWPGLDYKNGDKVQNERWLGFLPLYHAYGQMYAVMMACKFQVPIYIMRQFIYEDFLRAIQDYKITDLQVAPPVLVMMAKRPETQKYNLQSINSVLCGGAPLGKDLQNEIARKFNCIVKQGWGMTEVTCGSILQYESSDNGNVGKLIPNNKMRLVDDNDREVGFDTPGEILIQAPNVMLGYWRNEAATKDSLTSDGWLKTGDVAVINKDGYIWIVDRKKELIKVNALQVAPAELEGILLDCEHVADAAVVGITVHDEEWPRAYVALTEEAKKAKVSPKDIQQWFKPRVAKHKALVGGVQFVDEIPKLMSGKIQRKVMKEWSKRDAPEVAKSFDRARL
ncbi:Putative AMP-dependent synthetase/ligase, AMP-binding, AMP-binding enzyme domain, ANL [Septoria linicola]|uniref:AMP-dependent synthetase/ligase, AMP-binding, AMP-binding enzyme domain, ANL n=1 Tax=Septoria linicola TaxID=215465 RepID=A0A9Q9AUQ4_9PEZI|nr:Putative AMP-dependent synthetase/ligase, AMP-binding, AMP-binding enzyme domain, ANL [Septoria linicola]